MVAQRTGNADTSRMNTLPCLTRCAIGRPSRSAAAAALAASILALPRGCDIKTSDRDLVMLDPQAAIDRFHERGSLLSKATVACYVDPRSAAEYAEGHLPGAINVPLVRMPEEARALLAGHDLFIVYGSTFQDPMAKAGAKRLLELGFKEVFVMDGGTRAWEKDGYKLVTGSLPAGGNPQPRKEGAADPKDGGAEVPEEQDP